MFDAFVPHWAQSVYWLIVSWMDEGSGILWGHHLALSWWDLHLPAEMQTAAGPGKHQHTQMMWGCIYMVVVFLGFSSDAGQSREKEGRRNTSGSETGKRTLW